MITKKETTALKNALRTPANIAKYRKAIETLKELHVDKLLYTLSQPDLGQHPNIEDPIIAAALDNYERSGWVKAVNMLFELEEILEQEVDGELLPAFDE